MVGSTRDDLIELSQYSWQRLWDRMAGLTDEEYFWEPVADFSTLAWRLSHIADFLREERNGPWLGRPVPEVPARGGDPSSAAQALAALQVSYDAWREVLDGTTEQSLAAPIGEPAGPYGTASRRSFVLHVLDELIHHGAEAALLRDLYRASRGGGVR
ncbi:putative damage-inducible protein DinB [Catenulispora sp. MAP12-49]|uniref:DinB family protein n=1 Tax=Catenulispora sp. MAP12-49 TaxID=3156302 RepID=UPI003512F722